MFGRGFGFFGGQDPFAAAFAQMDSVMGAMLHQNDPLFGGPLRAAPLQQLPSQRARQPAVQIEEVDDMHPLGSMAADEPIVEEPDDDSPPADRAAQRQRRHSPQRAAAPPPAAVPALNPFGPLFSALSGGAMPAGGSGGSTFMFSSSSYSSMGPGGVTYQSSSTTRVGPGGVRETQAVVRDARTGTEQVTISRGLGDRERTLVRTRDATGRERHLEDLKGVNEHEADVFDEQWRQHAERVLPGGGAVGAVTGRLAGSNRNGSGGSGGGQRPLALPSSSGGPGAAAPTTLYSNGYGAGVTTAAATAGAGPRRSHNSHTAAAYPAASGSARGQERFSSGAQQYTPSAGASTGRTSVRAWAAPTAGGNASAGMGGAAAGGGSATARAPTQRYSPPRQQPAAPTPAYSSGRQPATGAGAYAGTGAGAYAGTGAGAYTGTGAGAYTGTGAGAYGTYMPNNTGQRYRY